MRCHKCGGTLFSCQCRGAGRRHPPEEFPAEIGQVIDEVFAALPRVLELDEDGRFIRGTHQGKTVREVLEERARFNGLI